MIILLVLTFAAGTGFGILAHREYVRRMWKLARRFRRAAMGGNSPTRRRS